MTRYHDKGEQYRDWAIAATTCKRLRDLQLLNDVCLKGYKSEAFLMAL